jgi:FixJ family two-component response regulator
VPFLIAMTELPPTVYVVDDEPAVLKALARLLRSAGFRPETFSSARDFIVQHQANAPGCLVLDMTMPGFTGLELQQWLTQTHDPLPVIFITGYGDVPTSVRAMKAGAVDFLTKPVDEQALLTAIENALRRDREARAARAGLASIHERLARLTPREREVLEHVVSGQLNKQIAADLGTVEKTIKVHRGRVMRKMEVESLAELVRLAEQAGVGRRDAKKSHPPAGLSESAPKPPSVSDKP